MNLYLFDPPHPPLLRRDWDNLLPQAFTPVRLENRMFFEGRNEARNGVVVVHLTELPIEEADNIFISAERRDLYLILVSGGEVQIPFTSSYVYKRKAPVVKESLDITFKKCFARFWDDLQQTGKPQFSLLEPDDSPAHLVAILILCQGYLVVSATPSQECPPKGSKFESALRDMGLVDNRINQLLDKVQPDEIQESEWWLRPFNAISNNGVNNIKSSDLCRLFQDEWSLSGGSSLPQKLNALLDIITKGQRITDPNLVAEVYFIIKEHLRNR